MTNIGSIFKHSESGSLFMLFTFAGAGGPSTYVQDLVFQNIRLKEF